MATLAEQIHEADRQEAESNLQKRIQKMTPAERDILIWYLKATGEVELARKLFGIDNLDIQQSDAQIHIPDNSLKIYRWREYWEKWWDTQKLSEWELNLLLSGFFHLPAERKYIVETFFYKDRFIHKTSGDIMDYLKKMEELFQRTQPTQNRVISRIHPQIKKEMEDIVAANDNHFTPLAERIWELEPWYFDYIHETYQARLEFVESLFIETIRYLADEPQNHIWALDPERHSVYIPQNLEPKIKLIESICEFHRAINPHFPLLHTLVPSTLGAWILLYKWFSAPVHTVRRILWSR